MAFPLTTFPRRQAIRQEYNPLDKSTIFSIFPKALNDFKCTIVPGVFHVPPGTPENPSRLVVGTSSWFREIDETQPMLEIPQSSIIVARSVVMDYCNGIFGCDMDQAMPGWFFLPGDISVAKLKSDEVVPGEETEKLGITYKSVLALAIRKQREFYERQIKLADALWARTNGSPLAITDDMRLAARELGQERAWTSTTQSVELIRCIACGNMRNAQFPICSSCNRVIDVELAKSLGIGSVELGK